MADWIKNRRLKERNQKRDKQLKQTFEAYLKALNITAKDFKNDEKTREKILSALSNSEGQVQALQALGTLLDHTSSIIARNEQTLQGFMTTFLESERDEIDTREQKEQSILEAYKSLKNLQIIFSSLHLLSFFVFHCRFSAPKYFHPDSLIQFYLHCLYH